MPSGHKPTLSRRRRNELRQRLTYTIERPGDLRVVVQRYNQAITVAIAHTLKHELQSGSKSKRPKGASLRAATAREKAHPPIRPQRRDVGRRAVRRKQEEEQLREVSSTETQESNPGDFVEGVAKVHFHTDPTRVKEGFGVRGLLRGNAV